LKPRDIAGVANRDRVVTARPRTDAECKSGFGVAAPATARLITKPARSYRHFVTAT